MTLNFAALAASLPVMAYGMAGIFIVMAVIAVSVWLLKKFG